jgi:hypothetical protein
VCLDGDRNNPGIQTLLTAVPLVSCGFVCSVELLCDALTLASRLLVQLVTSDPQVSLLPECMTPGTMVKADKEAVLADKNQRDLGAEMSRAWPMSGKITSRKRPNAAQYF